MFGLEGIEWISAAANVVYVVLAAKGKRICWLFGIWGAAGYVYLNLTVGLYMDAVLQSFYLLAGIAGYLSWKSAEPEAVLMYRKLALNRWISVVPLLALGTWLLYELAHRLPGNALPLFDAAITMASFFATWLTIRKVIENWPVWIFIDLAAAVMYGIKGLEVTMGLYLFYTMVAGWGWYQWKKNGKPLEPN